MARHRVVWTDTATSDLEAIITHIAEEDVVVALEVLARIQSRCGRLSEFPQRGRIVPELRSVDVLTYRELIEDPWRIIYRFEARRVYVVGVLDARRSLTGLLLERLSR